MLLSITPRSRELITQPSNLSQNNNALNSSISPLQTRTRPPHSTDLALYAAFFDSALPYLAARGSAAQWGTLRMAERPGFEKRAEEWGERYMEAREKGGLWAMITESEIDWDVNLRKGELGELRYPVDGDSGRRFLVVAAAVVREGWFPGYVEVGLGEYVREAREKGEWVYLEILVSDFRTGEWRRGGGAALVERVRAEAVGRGLRGFYVDCWAGNKGVLIRFYEDQGFKLLGTFSAKKSDTETWDVGLLIPSNCVILL